MSQVASASMEYAHLLATPVQVVSGSKEITLPSGVTYTDVKIGGGSPVQKGYLMILDFKYACVTSVQPVMPSCLRHSVQLTGNQPVSYT